MLDALSTRLVGLSLRLPLRLSLGLALGSAVASCSLFAGVDDVTFASGVPDAGAPMGCLVEPGGDARMRPGNLVPEDRRIAFCARFGAGPLSPLLGVGSTCQNGLAFAELSRPLAAPPGPVSIVAIESGSSCDSPAIASTDVILRADSTTSVLAVGGHGSPVQIVALDEGHPAPSEEVMLRVVHAVVGADSVDVGRTSSSMLPAEISTPFVHDVAFGTAATEANQVDATFPLRESHVEVPSSNFALGARKTGSSAAILTGRAPFDPLGFHVLSLFAVGAVGDPLYLPQVMICDDLHDDADRTSCLPRWTFSVETFNVSANDLGTYLPLTRVAPIGAALASSPADVLCLTEIALPEAHDAILAATSGVFPYVVELQTDDTTPIDAVHDLDGTIPSPRTTPPCAALPDETNAGMECLIENCSTIPGDPAGMLTSEDCAQAMCSDAVFALLSSVDARICLGCVRSAYRSYSLGETLDRCLTQPEFPLAFQGRHEVLLLSRRPIDGPERLVLPGTGSHRVVLRAPVRLDDGSSLDVYCSRFSAIRDGAYDVYPGVYGGGSQDVEGWVHEQAVQAKATIEFAQSRSKDRPAIVTGWFGTSRKVERHGEVILQDLAPGTLDRLEAAFTSGEAPDYPEQCTECPFFSLDTPPCTGCLQNPIYHDTLAGIWTDRVFLLGSPSPMPLSTERIYTELVIDVTPSAKSSYQARIPLSDTYGLRSLLRLRP